MYIGFAPMRSIAKLIIKPTMSAPPDAHTVRIVIKLSGVWYTSFANTTTKGRTIPVAKLLTKKANVKVRKFFSFRARSIVVYPERGEVRGVSGEVCCTCSHDSTVGNVKRRNEAKKPSAMPSAVAK